MSFCALEDRQHSLARVLLFATVTQNIWLYLWPPCLCLLWCYDSRVTEEITPRGHKPPSPQGLGGSAAPFKHQPLNPGGGVCFACSCSSCVVVLSHHSFFFMFAFTGSLSESERSETENLRGGFSPLLPHQPTQLQSPASSIPPRLGSFPEESRAVDRCTWQNLTVSSVLTFFLCKRTAQARRHDQGSMSQNTIRGVFLFTNTIHATPGSSPLPRRKKKTKENKQSGHQQLMSETISLCGRALIRFDWHVSSFVCFAELLIAWKRGIKYFKSVRRAQTLWLYGNMYITMALQGLKQTSEGLYARDLGWKIKKCSSLRVAVH